MRESGITYTAAERRAMRARAATQDRIAVRLIASRRPSGSAESSPTPFYVCLPTGTVQAGEQGWTLTLDTGEQSTHATSHAALVALYAHDAQARRSSAERERERIASWLLAREVAGEQRAFSARQIDRRTAVERAADRLARAANLARERSFKTRSGRARRAVDAY